MNVNTEQNTADKSDHSWISLSPFTLLVSLGAMLFMFLTFVEFISADEHLSYIDISLELLENALLAGTMVLMAFIASETRLLRREHRLLTSRLSSVESESGHWRAIAESTVGDLNRAIERQFVDWGLSDAEQEVARLMLKGFSHKEIGRLRSSSDATVRQQASAVYHKSGCPNRSEFVAYFLDALILQPAAPSQRLSQLSSPKSSAGESRSTI